MTFPALRSFPDLARSCARMFPRQPGIGTFSLQPAFPATSSASARRGSASGPQRCQALPFRLSSRRVTVRPNQSFKPTPLRGAA